MSSMRTIRIFLALVCMVGVALVQTATGATERIASAPTPTGSLWGATATSLYTDTKCRAVGDILTVLVIQQSSATSASKHATSKDMDTQFAAGNGVFSGFAGAGARAKQSTAGTGTNITSASVWDKVSVTVQEVLPNGYLRVAGIRKITMEKDTMQMSIRGLVRPQDIQPDNTIPSTLITDQQIELKGVGPVAEKCKPGLLTRLLSFLW